MVLSVAVKNGLYSVVIADNGIVKKSTTKYLSVDKENPTIFDNLIEATLKGVTLLKSYIDENSEVTDVVVEINNSTFKKWIESGYAQEMYWERFMELLTTMDKIPVRYYISVVKKPQASVFLNKKYVEKVSLSTFDALDFGVDEEV